MILQWKCEGGDWVTTNSRDHLRISWNSQHHGWDLFNNGVAQQFPFITLDRAKSFAEQNLSVTAVGVWLKEGFPSAGKPEKYPRLQPGEPLPARKPVYHVGNALAWADFIPGSGIKLTDGRMARGFAGEWIIRENTTSGTTLYLDGKEIFSQPGTPEGMSKLQTLAARFDTAAAIKLFSDAQGEKNNRGFGKGNKPPCASESFAPGTTIAAYVTRATFRTSALFLSLGGGGGAALVVAAMVLTLAAAKESYRLHDLPDVPSEILNANAEDAR